MASPGSNDDGAAPALEPSICCMCGDHGLPGELFQCGLCLHRLQHRYCSDLYPRVAAYRSCNWCLRDEERGGASPVNAPPPATTAKRRASSSRLITNSRDHDGKDDDHAGGPVVVLLADASLRSAFGAEPGEAVKKPKKSSEGAAPLRPVEKTAVKGRMRKAKASASKPSFRAKARARRYKLLTEVISF